MISAESKIELGAPMKFSRGTIAKQAEAPPARSAPYKVDTRPLYRENTMENRRPVPKNGRAVAIYIALSLAKFLPLTARVTGVCTTTSRAATIKKELASEIQKPNAEISIRLNHERRMWAKIPPEPNPS